MAFFFGILEIIRLKPLRKSREQPHLFCKLDALCNPAPCNPGVRGITSSGEDRQQTWPFISSAHFTFFNIKPNYQRKGYYYSIM